MMMYCHHTAMTSPGASSWRLPRPARAKLLLVHGPFAYLPGEGEQYITATWRDGRWQIEPNTTGYPRRGTSAGD
jgi:hypothetical protein